MYTAIPLRRLNCLCLDINLPGAYVMHWSMGAATLSSVSVDAEHIGNLTAPVLSLAARHTRVVRVSQGGDELTLELAYRAGANAGADGLV
jgi:hypothetical protein